MKTLKYKAISSLKQYKEYCRILHDMDFAPGRKSRATLDEMELLHILIDAYDREHFPIPEVDPVQMIRIVMENSQMNATTMAAELGITKSYLSLILNYKKGISKGLVRKLAERFKMQQEAFNRPYTLTGLKGKKKKAA